MYIASQLLMFSTIVFTVTPRPCFFATPTKGSTAMLQQENLPSTDRERGELTMFVPHS